VRRRWWRRGPAYYASPRKKRRGSIARPSSLRSSPVSPDTGRRAADIIAASARRGYIKYGYSYIHILYIAGLSRTPLPRERSVDARHAAVHTIAKKATGPKACRGSGAERARDAARAAREPASARLSFAPAQRQGPPARTASEPAFTRSASLGPLPAGRDRSTADAGGSPMDRGPPVDRHLVGGSYRALRARGGAHVYLRPQAAMCTDGHAYTDGCPCVCMPCSCCSWVYTPCTQTGTSSVSQLDDGIARGRGHASIAGVQGVGTASHL
jgi:hypothetical protein